MKNLIEAFAIFLQSYRSANSSRRTMTAQETARRTLAELILNDVGLTRWERSYFPVWLRQRQYFNKEQLSFIEDTDNRINGKEATPCK